MLLKLLHLFEWLSTNLILTSNSETPWWKLKGKLRREIVCYWRTQQTCKRNKTHKVSTQIIVNNIYQEHREWVLEFTSIVFVLIPMRLLTFNVAIIGRSTLGRRSLFPYSPSLLASVRENRRPFWIQFEPIAKLQKKGVRQPPPFSHLINPTVISSSKFHQSSW